MQLPALDISIDDDDYDLPYGEELVDMDIGEIDEVYNDSLDEYIGAEVVIPGKDGVAVLAKVRKRKRDHNNDPIGKKNSKPILDSRIYKIEFPDGRVEEYAGNVIAENLLEQADDEGWDSGILAEVIDHRIDDRIAIPKSTGTVTSYNGTKQNVITTK